MRRCLASCLYEKREIFGYLYVFFHVTCVRTCYPVEETQGDNNVLLYGGSGNGM